MENSQWHRDAVELYSRFQFGAVTPDEMRAELPSVWRLRPDADPLGSDAAWRAMIDHAGYFKWKSGQIGGRRTRRPLRARRLFRGATHDRRFGMSWTRNRAIATHFAHSRQASGAKGEVWVAVFRPSRLLAHIEDEEEYLVNAVGVDVQLWTPENGRG